MSENLYKLSRKDIDQQVGLVIVLYKMSRKWYMCTTKNRKFPMDSGNKGNKTVSFYHLKSHGKINQHPAQKLS